MSLRPLLGCLFPGNSLEQFLDSSDFVGGSGSYCKHDLVEHDVILSQFQQFAICMPYVITMKHLTASNYL